MQSKRLGAVAVVEGPPAHGGPLVGDCALVAGVVEIASVAVEEAKSDPGGWVLSTTFSGERGRLLATEPSS
jgi:hypothetical protein